ncbi:ABC transporter permease [Candidatus Sumerlaeota bacterium]|nr:ABC transporter permease [Candidatus Sumerlaeota bacterium]
MAVIIYKMLQREYWRVAFREVFRRPIVVVCFVILCAYTLIALLDSVGYHPPLRDENDKIVRNEAGEAIIDHYGLSLLDVILKPLRKHKERTYSAPFADAEFTKSPEIVTKPGPDGAVISKVERINKPLKHRHWFGTDKTGRDVLYLALKGVRTGMIIGAFTTALIAPFAMFFGIVAGYYGRWIDDLIQYFYSVLASIPSVLLVVAFMIVFGRGLPQLCIVMGITSWTGLCRVLRGETLKLREMEYIQACQAMGVPRWKIMLKHIAPNVMHIVLITCVLNFSGAVLAEAVLSYIGIGVGPDTISWGVMINDARSELARDPVIWWKLGAAFIFMLGLVLPANLFGDALRDALDPRLRTQ